MEVISGRRFRGALLPGLGFAGVTAVGGLITCFSGLAHFTTAVLVALAVVGYGLSFPWRGRGIGRLPLLGAIAVFLIYGAPVILSGTATFLGYIKLDDTATWLAFTDQVLQHGHSVAGLAPSSYEATVQINLGAGYPLGAFIPLAVGSQLTGTDPAWLFQPYLAVMAAMMALALYELSRPVIANDRIRAAVIFVAAQPALLVGYAFWGGVKEVDTALLLAVLAATAAYLARPGSLRQSAVAPVVAGAALIGVMGAGGAPWLLAIFAGGLLWAWLAIGFRTLLPRALLLLGGLVLIGLPTIFAGGHFFSPIQGGLTSGDEMGNLIKALSPAQFAGPWPVGDFRIDPSSMLLTVVLVLATVLAWGAGVWFSVRSRAWAVLVFAAGTGLGSLAIWLAGSPWVQGKALATGTASFLLIAMIGIAALLQQKKNWFKGIGLALLIVPVGVLASNALAYHETYLAPRAQLSELESIGKEFAGQGPALMTEYQAYGVRHFLRNLDAEGVSELRRRLIPLLDGSSAEKGAWVDTDRLKLSPAAEGLLTYRTLVLRRNPEQSRPPSPYNLVWRGDYYEVWQRPADFDPASIIRHRPLGGGLQPAAVARCPLVAKVAAKAGPRGIVAGAPRGENAVSTFTKFPPDWVADPSVGSLTPLSDGTADGTIDIPASGAYTVYLSGSTRGRVSVSIDGEPVGAARARLNNNAQFIELDTRDFSAGKKSLTMTYGQGSPLRPGTGGYPFALGPVVLAPAGSQSPVTKLPTSDYRQLCGHRLDWLEALK